MCVRTPTSTTSSIASYGFNLGGWVGGQAEYMLVPYADWNLLRFPDKEQAIAKILDLTPLSDILPTGYHGCIEAGVRTGSDAPPPAPASSAPHASSWRTGSGSGSIS
jgi:threonine dehydrogenase-like Zn-dependent dehydrogenase